MSLTTYFDAFAGGYQPYKGGAWCYEDGCVYRGLELLTDATGDPRWRAHLLRLINAQIGPDGALAGYDPKDFNIDNILSGRALFTLARDSGDPRYMAAARRLIDQLDRQPRIAAGNYWHKKRYPHQVWLDGLYMGLPFLIEYALATGEDRRIADALDQLRTALEVTATFNGLHAHGYDESREQRWSDPETGQSPAVWARAMGWLAMALVDVLALLQDDARVAGLRERSRAILLAVLSQQSPSGLWPQVLDAPELKGNYDESSASAMFAYAFLRAVRLGQVSSVDVARLREGGLATLHALETTRIGEADGAVRFQGICHVAGLGGFEDNYRDGTPEYYLTEHIVADDAKGVGPLMMAFAERTRLFAAEADPLPARMAKQRTGS